MMQDDGFTVVEQAGQKMASKRKKATDTMGETVHGISQEEAKRIYSEQLRRGKHIIGLSEEEIKAERERVFKEDRESEALKGLNLEAFYNPGKGGSKSSLYAFEEREKKKADLEKLRSDFEGFKRQLAKRQAKDVNRERQLMRM